MLKLHFCEIRKDQIKLVVLERRLHFTHNTNENVLLSYHITKLTVLNKAFHVFVVFYIAFAFSIHEDEYIQ